MQTITRIETSAALLLGARSLWAPVSIDLSRQWRMAPGDNLAWASTDLDYRSWATATFPPSDRFFDWLRRHLDLPGNARIPHALTFDPPARAANPQLAAVRISSTLFLHSLWHLEGKGPYLITDPASAPTVVTVRRNA